MIRAVSPAQLAAAWPHIEPHLKRFEERGEASAERLRYLAEQREAQVWTQGDEAVHGVIVTQVEQTVRGRRLLILVAVGTAGDLPAITNESLSVLTAWGRACGCTRVRVSGRKGWAKVLPGFREVGRILEREL